MFNGNLAPGGLIKNPVVRRRKAKSPLLPAKLCSRVAAFRVGRKAVKPVAELNVAPFEPTSFLVQIKPAAQPEVPREERADQDSLLSIYMREAGQVALLTVA